MEELQKNNKKHKLFKEYFFSFKKSLRYLFNSFLFFLTLFTVIVAFNEDKLATYESVDGQGKYNWLNPLDIYEFYCSQVKLNVDEKNTYNIGFDEDKNINKYYYYIDRTGSLEKNYKDPVTIELMKDEIIKELVYGEKKINKEDLLKSKDYRSLLTIFSLVGNIKKDRATNSCIYDYNGSNVTNHKITSQKSVDFFLEKEKIETIKKIDSKLEQKSYNEAKTYFSDLFSEISRDIYLENENDIRPNKYIVTIISDFISDVEEGKNKKWQLNKFKASLSKYDTISKNIEFKLIVLPTNENDTSKTINANSILTHLKNSLEYAYVYNFDIEKRKKDNEFSEDFKVFNNYPTYIPKRNKILHSYYPLKHNRYKNTFDTKHSYLSLNLFKGTYYIRSSKKLFYGTSIKSIKDTIFKGKLSKVEVLNSGNYFFKSPIKISDPLFLDISRRDKTFFNRYKIIAKEKLSYFASFTLFFALGLILNTSILFFMLWVIILMNLFIKKKICSIKKFHEKVIFILPVILSLIAYSIPTYANLSYDYLQTFFPFLIIAFIYSMVFITFLNKDLKKNYKKLFKPNK